MEVTEDTGTIGVAFTLHRSSGTFVPGVETTAQRLVSGVGVDVVHIDLSHHKEEWTVAGRFEFRCFQYLRVETRRVLEETYN